MSRSIGTNVRRTFVALAALLAVSGFAGHANAARRARKAPVQGVVNLNTATPEQMTLLPGVGLSKAQAVIAYRTEHPFQRVEEVRRVRGFGKKMFARLKAFLAIDGESTLHAVRRAPTANPEMDPPTE